MRRFNGKRKVAEVPLFAQCSRREIERIDRLMTEISIRPGDVLTHEGCRGRQCFVIADGKAAVMIGDNQVATLERGAVVGEMALLDGGQRTATVIAETPMRVYVMDPASFDSLIQDVPTVARQIMTTLSRRLRENEALAG